MTASTKQTLLALLAAAATLAPAAAHAHGRPPVVPPEVPANLEVPAGHRAYLITHAVGTQNQVCLPRTSGAGLGWSAFGPQATLFDDRGAQVATHFLSLNPDETATARPTWQHARDSSAVWAMPIASSADPAYVEAGAVPWLLLQVVGAAAGPGGGDRFTETTYIQRVETSGGVTPAEDCPALGAKKFVAYTADYVFYRAE